MEYIVRITRPLIDDKVMDVPFASKAEAATGMVQFILLEESLERGSKIVDIQQTEEEIKVILTTGLIWAFPKGAH